MYSEGLVVDKASTIGINIPTGLREFLQAGGWGQNVRNLASFSTSLASRSHSTFELPTFENAARYPNPETMLRLSPYVLAKFCEVGSIPPEKAVSCDPPPKIQRYLSPSSFASLLYCLLCK